MNRLANAFPWQSFLLVILITIPFASALLSENPVGSAYPDTDLDYFIRLHHSSFQNETALPKWNPQEICGAPVLSEIQSGLFYPLNQIFRWMPVFQAVSFYFWFHIILLALFTYAFARQLSLSKPASILTALTFTFSSHIILGIYAGKLSNIASLTWLPLLLMLVCKIKAKQNIHIYAGMGVIFAFQFNAGHFQYMYYSLILVFFFHQYCLFKQHNRFWTKKIIIRQLDFLGAGIIALCLCLPQLIAVFKYVQQTERSALSISHSGQFSFPLDNLFTIFFPGIFGDMQSGLYWGTYNLWEMSAYCGIMPLILCIVAIKQKKLGFDKFFLWAGGFSLILALGENTPLFKILYNFIPGISWFRGHSKAISIFCLCLAVFSGKGMDLIRSDSYQITDKKHLIKLFIVTVLICFILLILQSTIAFSFIDTWITHTVTQASQYLPIQSITQSIDGRSQAIHYSLNAISKGLVSILFSLWILYHCKKWTIKKRTLIIMFIAVADLIHFAGFYIQTVDKSNFQMTQTVSDFFKQDSSYFRVLDLSPQNFEPLSKLQVITSDRPYIWHRYTRFMNMFLFGQPIASMKLPPVKRMSDGFHMMNVKYIIQRKNTPIPCKTCIRKYTDDSYDIYENTAVLPRVFLAEHITSVNSPDDALKRLSNKDVISGKNVIIEKNVEKQNICQSKFDTTNSQVSIIKYSNDEVIIHSKMIEAGWLVFLDSWSDGWQAICDEKQQLDIHIANYLFRAVYIPRGNHEIKFVYSP
ncbi:conserved hypothetical protein, membrane [Candidatus Magnetomorum sp. HK-1]|nr:conserved hypothetical protein, membrane [Candidatus Magnetomorum sp. HK-1]